MNGNSARYRREWIPDPQFDNDSLTKVYNLIAPGSSVLDLGCSVGQLGQALKTRKGCFVVGADCDSESVRIASEVLDSATLCDLEHELLEQKFQGMKFDHIVFADVLEHLADPVLVLRSAQKLLNPEGSILISIPNVAHASVRLSLLEGRFEYRSEGLLDRTHKSFYTKQSLYQLLNQAELAIIEVDRTYLGALDTEIKIETRGLISSELISALENENEATTYQFIVQAVPVGSTLVREGIQKHFDNFEREVKGLKSQLHIARSNLGIPPGVGINAAQLSLSSRIDQLESSLSAQKGELLRRLEIFEMRIQALERTKAEEILSVREDIVRVRQHLVDLIASTAAELNQLLPIRLWRKLRGR